MKVGDPIILVLQLPGGETDRHVRAFVESERGTPHPLSPVTLTHVSNGKYVAYDPGLTFPAGAIEMHATFIAYVDDAFEVPDETNGRGLDVFRLDTETTPLDQILTIVTAIQKMAAQQMTADLTGVVVDDDVLVGVVLDDNT